MYFEYFIFTIIILLIFLRLRKKILKYKSIFNRNGFDGVYLYFVNKKKWMDDKNFLDIVSFSNFLPGPSSSQVGMCIGYLQRGSLGAFFAWLGFTLPSAIIMIGSAYGLLFYSDFFTNGLLSGIKACVVVIVFQAILGMSKQYLNDYKTII